MMKVRSRDEQQQPKDEQDLDLMVNNIIYLCLKAFYDLIDFNADQHLAITIAQ